MSTLHTINKSPFSHSTLLSCLHVCEATDEILLIEDGVFGAIKNCPYAQELATTIARGVNIYALQSDINARGLQKKIDPSIQITDYIGFVRLSIEHSCTQSWY